MRKKIALAFQKLLYQLNSDANKCRKSIVEIDFITLLTTQVVLYFSALHFFIVHMLPNQKPLVTRERQGVWLIYSIHRVAPAGR